MSFARSMFRLALGGTTIATASVPSAEAQTVTLSGIVVNACVLTLTTPGVLAAASSGTELSTTQTGGTSAVMNVVATGTNPTITFSAAGLTGPSSGSATAELAYSSPGGASRSYSSAGYVYPMTQLLDTVTVDGRALASTGFQSGVYTITTTATCAQP